MKNISILQLALGLFTLNSSVTCMFIVPALTKKSFSKRPCSFIVASKDVSTEKDKMAYYKQFCSVNYPKRNTQQEQPQAFTAKISSPQEDKMAYYKKFITTQ